MSYTIDNQTYIDLNLTGRYKTNSIFSLFNQTLTKGGSNIMEKAFSEPFTTAEEVNAARDTFIAFGKLKNILQIEQKDVEEVDEYMGVSSPSSLILSLISTYRLKLAAMVLSDNTFESSIDGIKKVQNFLNNISNFVFEVKTVLPVGRLLDKVNVVVDFLNEERIQSFLKDAIAHMGYMKIADYNMLLRSTQRKNLTLTIRLIEELDFYLTVAKVGKKHAYTYANAISGDMTFNIKNMRHPCVPGAVGNDVIMTHSTNLMFLTGANMAGKSTLMKSFGISLYLAQLGFPLAADSMTFTPMEGMFTSINVPDDISQGYSHFYAEVMRVKGVAEEVAKKKRLLIIFDELFKGTNVKDAYDGTAAITRAFSRCDRSMFIISTHIMEVGEMLKTECSNVLFRYLPTILENDRPRYTYKLTEGIADDRYGLKIIHNERIIDIIKESV